MRPQINYPICNDVDLSLINYLNNFNLLEFLKIENGENMGSILRFQGANSQVYKTIYAKLKTLKCPGSADNNCMNRWGSLLN